MRITKHKVIEYSPLVISLIINLIDPIKPQDFLNNINNPSIRPPNWIFPIVWPILYYLIGKSTKEYYKIKGKVPIVHIVQLILNYSWSPVFFKKEKISAAYNIIRILLVLIIYNFIIYYKTKESIGFLYLPYILWVSFATLLNSEYKKLNPNL